MTFLRLIYIYFSTLVFLVLLDSIWIGFLMSDIYKSNIAKILSISKDSVTFNPIAGIFAWLLIAFGAIFFVFPLTKNLNNLFTFFYGALFGLVMYGVFEFTNMATFKNWSLKTAIIDIFWGMLLNGLIAIFLRYIQKYF